MKKQDYYWIIGAIIGIGIANYLTRRRIQEEEQMTIESLKRVDDMLNDALKRQTTNDLQETLSKALEDSNKLREQTDKELKVLTERMREERRKKLKDLEAEIKEQDEKTRFS